MLKSGFLFIYSHRLGPKKWEKFENVYLQHFSYSFCEVSKTGQFGQFLMTADLQKRPKTALIPIEVFLLDLARLHYQK